ncbi:hypothetical protein ESCOMMO078M1_06925 [Escherichia coli]
MSDNNLRLQVILNAVDKLTRPFRSAQASSRELAAAVKKSRDAIKQLDQAGSSLDSFRKLQAENQKLGDRLNYARQRANLLSQETKQGDYLVGTDENVLVLNRTYANRSNAERAAKMQWERLQRGVASFSLQLAEGRADLYTEMPVKVSGFKQPIDDAEWTITTLTHTVSPDNGFTTSLELEVRIDDFEME